MGQEIRFRPESKALSPSEAKGTLCVLKVRKQKRTLTLASNPFPRFIRVRLRSTCCDVNDVRVAFEINQMCSQLITAPDLSECSSFKHS